MRHTRRARGLWRGIGGGEVSLSRRLTRRSAIVFVGLVYSMLVGLFGPSSAFALPPAVPSTGSPVSVSNSSEGFSGALSPVGASFVFTWSFRYAEGSSCSGAGASATPEGFLGKEAEMFPVEATATGLRAGTLYTVCLVAGSEEGETTQGNEVSFTTGAVEPAVGEQAAANLSATGARLNASINGMGSLTSYHVEYVTDVVFKESGFSQAARVPVPPAMEDELGAANGAIPVSVNVAGLEPATLYDFRFSATSPVGTGVGAPVAFTTTSTAAPASLALPDKRAYELVSHPPNPGEEDSSETYIPDQPSQTTDTASQMPFRAAASGDAVAYVGDPSNEGGNGSQGKGLGNQYLGVRGVGGWRVSELTPSEGKTSQGEIGGEAATSRYESFSSDLTTGVLASQAPSLALSAIPGGPLECSVVYTHDEAGFHSLFTNPQPPGSSCGSPVRGEGDEQFGGGNAGAVGVPGFSRLLVQSEGSLVPGVPAAPGSGQDDLYASAGGVLYPVNVLPGGGVEVAATFGAPSAGLLHSPNLGDVISGDGSRVFWSSVRAVTNERGEVVEQLPTALYVRENPASPDAATVQLDVSEGSGESGGGRFWAASGDGSRVFFTDESRLTSDSMATAGAPDLYVYDFNEPAGERLTDLTVSAGEPADVKGVMGASQDGSYVYFVAGGALTPGATPGSCEEAEQPEKSEEEDGVIPAGRACNVYVWHEGAALARVATLAPEDDRRQDATETSEKSGDWVASLRARTSEVAPDGRHVLFESRQKLTGHEVAAPGRRALVQVYVFSAGSGHVACVSCSPTGALPAPEPPSVEEVGGAGGARLPVSFSGTFLRRWMSDDGFRVFFDSGQPLVSQDVNGVQDVYEWEQEGTGGCQVVLASPLNAGCLSLLSGGESRDFSAFVDASETGSDVFFATRERLLPVDRDEKLDLYDARENGGVAVVSGACTSTGCQGVPPAPPVFATPASETFEGVGNFPTAPVVIAPKTAAQLRAERLAKALRACRVKRKGRARVACEVVARKRYGTRAKKSAKGSVFSGRRGR